MKISKVRESGAQRRPEDTGCEEEHQARFSKHCDAHGLKFEVSRPESFDSVTSNFGASKKGSSTQGPLWVTLCC